MNTYVRLLKDCAVQACQKDYRLRSTLFSDFALEDLLIRADEESLTPKEIVASFLWEVCCTSEGRFNGCLAAIKTIHQFINESLRKPSDIAYQDLGAILKSGTTKAAIDRWVASTFD